MTDLSEAFEAAKQKEKEMLEFLSKPIIELPRCSYIGMVIDHDDHGRLVFESKKDACF